MIKDYDLQFLVMWPSGSRGEDEEYRIVQQLNQFGKKIGYGRLAQIAESLKDVCDIHKYADIQLRHRSMLSGGG